MRCVLTVVGGLSWWSGVSLAAEEPKPVKNLIKNGDFSGGASHWQGRGRVEVFSPPETTKAFVEGLAAETKAATATRPDVPPLPVATPTARSSALLPSTKPSSPRPGEKADANRVWAISLGPKIQTFSQRFDVPRQAKVLRVSFKTFVSPNFKTERTTLGAIQVRVVALDSTYIFYDRKLAPTKTWHPIQLTYTIKEPARFLDLIVEVEPGEGELYCDDFVVEPLDG